MNSNLLLSLPALLFALLLASCATGPASEQLDASDWSARAKMDIQAGHQLMLDNHPGPIDAENPSFSTVADQALEYSLELAEKIDTPQGYSSVLSSYTSFFRDGHFGLYMNESRASEFGESVDSWPGFVIGWRAGVYSVVDSEPSTKVAVGSVLISCDGKTPDTLINERVFSFNARGPENETHFALLSPEIFRDSGNPLAERLRNCIFSDGEEQFTHKLEWKPWNTESYNALREKAQFGARPKTNISEVAPAVFWINLPDFNPSDDGVALNRLIAELEAAPEKFRNAKALVFDVRGNNGGNSVWGERVMTALYGEAYYNYRTYHSGEEVHWRATKGSVEKLEFYREQAVKQGNESMLSFLDRTIGGLNAALTKGDDFYRSTSDSKPPPESVENIMKAKTYVFTHGWCASSCLDFVDYAYAMEGMTHIGYPTLSDSNYMDIRIEELPSTYGRVLLPMKIYRGRKRGNGASYTPEITFNEFNWSDETVQEWFLNSVLEN